MIGHLGILLLTLLSTSRIAHADDVGYDFDPDDGEAWELNYGYYPFRSYHTTDLLAPAVRKLVDSPQCHDGLYTFFTPRGYSIQAPGPMIVDNNGDMVWAKSTEGQAYDLVVHNVKGEQFLTYWNGDDRIRGHGQGDYYMLNSSYQQVAKISAIGEDMKADLHEMVITPEGNAIITIYQVYNCDLTDYRDFGEGDDPNYIWDCLFQEIDIGTDELLFEWRASDHHSFNETFREIDGEGTKEAPWDWYHINSVQKDSLGNYLVSARFTHTVTYINGTSGDIIWILGGKRNMFKDLSDGLATKFANQHDARMMPLSTFSTLTNNGIRAKSLSENESARDGVTSQLLTIFDNSAEDGHYTDTMSHGLLLEVSFPLPDSDATQVQRSANLSVRSEGAYTHQWPFPRTARLIHSYDHPQGVISSSQGSLQVIPGHEAGQDPKILLGYGVNAVWTEFSADGKVLCDTHFATNYSWERGDVQSYRVFKFPWVGHPAEPPTTVLGENNLYVSWNGATEVKTWSLQQFQQYDDEALDDWVEIAWAPKSGFETAIEYDQDDTERYLRVTALDAFGNVIGVSQTIDTGWTARLAKAIPDMELPGSGVGTKVFVLFIFNAFALVLLWMVCRSVARRRRRRLQEGFDKMKLDSDA